MHTTTLSTKYQIVVPKEVRTRMKLRAGEQVTVYPVDEDHAVLVREHAGSVAQLDGLGKEVWHKLGGTATYLRKERTTWDKR